MNLEQLISFLQELSIASKNIKSKEDLQAAMREHDVLFLGEDFKLVYTDEFCYALSKKFKKYIPIEEINSLVPSACSYLNLEYKARYNIADLQNTTPAAYEITLK